MLLPYEGSFSLVCWMLTLLVSSSASPKQGVSHAAWRLQRDGGQFSLAGAQLKTVPTRCALD